MRIFMMHIGAFNAEIYLNNGGTPPYTYMFEGVSYDYSQFFDLAPGLYIDRSN